MVGFLEAAKEHAAKPYQATESWLERKIRIKAEKREAQERKAVEATTKCKLSSHSRSSSSPLVSPADDPQVRGDALKTLFVARLSYGTREMDLEKEFARFGPIERVSDRARRPPRLTR